MISVSAEAKTGTRDLANPPRCQEALRSIQHHHDLTQLSATQCQHY